jgi:hypothetical protein
MARNRTRRTAALAFDAITVEGALIAPAMLSRIAQHQAGGQTETDYGVPKGLTLRDEIARYFRIGQALFADLTASKTPSSAATVAFVEKLLRDVLGFADMQRVATRTIGERQFALTLEGLGVRVPVVVVPPSDELDHPSAHLPTDGRRRSAASAVQDWLNAGEGALWGMCSNGVLIRLVRGNASLTRPAYIEADLRRMFEGEAFADFAALWLLIQASRFGITGTPPPDCALERWRDAGQREGLAARDRLRDGVEAALLSLGGGFVSHSENGKLRAALQTGALPLPEFFGQLLRLVYRLIFLLAAEDRGLLHPPAASAAARKLYAEGYSVGTLRDRAVRRAAWDRHHDRWEGLLITFVALARGEPKLALPALDGLFAQGTIPDLENARLVNRSLMEAIYRLAWLKEDSGLLPVNWRDMETEELGSVYESLLELTPRLTDDGRGFAFAEGGETKGHARKISGSYYTPDSLVQVLLDSALDPVLDRVEAEADEPARGLLSVTVLDPACGSGHFLLGAARRIATRLARARVGGVAAPDDYRRALRAVARACIHGVDRNPMAVELTKVALWIETVEPGKPLGFLDANIRCGDSLLGVFDLKALEQGIPDAAYKPLSGDDRETAKHFEKRNKAEREGQGSLDFTAGGGRLPAKLPMAGEARALRAMPEDSPEEIAAKRKRFEAARTDPRRWNLRIASDLYIAAFLTPKTGGVPANRSTVTIPTTAHVWDALAGRNVYGPLVGRAQDLSGAARAFHWPLEFPDVMAAGGFDVVLGNPPWEVIQFGEEEYFAQRLPEIAELAGAARKRAIAALAGDNPIAFESYQAEKRRSEASNEFARASGRFDLTGRGKINTYALFAELFASLATTRGRAGVIVPTGIATDATTAPFFAKLVGAHQLARLIDFENRAAIFSAVHRSFKFSLLTIGRDVPKANFAFFLTNPTQLGETERRFTLSGDEIAKLNPNTNTAPVFRSRMDAQLTTKIYGRIPVLVDDAKGEAGNPWRVQFRTRIWNMTEDSAWFRTGAQLTDSGFLRERNDWTLPPAIKPRQGALDPPGGRDDRSLALTGGAIGIRLERYIPLYEAKMIHQFDHRWATYDGLETRDVTFTERNSAQFEPIPRYWVPDREVASRLADVGWRYRWLIGWRDICRSTDERTLVAAAIPAVGSGDKFLLAFPNVEATLCAVLLASINSLACDFVARQKIGGTSFKLFLSKQIPILPPSSYTEADLAFIVPRVLELTFTSHSMAPFARDLGYDGPPFAWDEDRRALLRAELDAWYARAYGLTRDELRYVLDPTDVKGPDYPSETFRVLEKNEIARFGEYRTARLVLRAWDRMERGETAEISPPLVVTAPAAAPTIAPVNLATLPDAAWAKASNGADATLAQLAALISALSGPMPIARVRLAALYALEPRYLTRRLSGADRAIWRRLVGPAAELLRGANITALAPKIDAGWRDSVTQLRGMGAILEDIAVQTWAAGPKLDEFEVDLAGWPYGRASFVLKAMEAMTLDEAVADLPAEDQVWARAHAA